MNGVLYHIVSGQAFFTGVALLVAAALASTRTHAVWGRVTAPAFLLGGIAVALSSTPLYAWWYAVCAGATLLWMASYIEKAWRRWTPIAMAVVWLAAAALEAPYSFLPTPKSASQRSLTVIGDSVTAGIGDDETSETWPAILAREHQLQVQDLSFPGAKTASALKRVQRHTITSPVVVVEIGGNDLFGSTSAAQFEGELNALVRALAGEGRQIVLLELPLPPFHHAYGRAQRTVAARHGVLLAPKRVFLSVLAGNDATLDTVHLSQEGHQKMAESVWRVIGPAYD